MFFWSSAELVGESGELARSAAPDRHLELDGGVEVDGHARAPLRGGLASPCASKSQREPRHGSGAHRWSAVGHSIDGSTHRAW